MKGREKTMTIRLIYNLIIPSLILPNLKRNIQHNDLRKNNQFSIVLSQYLQIQESKVFPLVGKLYISIYTV